MTREEAVELLPIIQAFSGGKPIQYRVRDTESANWNDIGENYHEFSPYSFQYRIKPEPKYRPFKDVEECWTEMQKHQPFGWIKGKEGEHRSLITSIITDEEEVYINGISGFVLDEIMEHYTFADGLPFGVKVEE